MALSHYPEWSIIVFDTNLSLATYDDKSMKGFLSTFEI